MQQISRFRDEIADYWHRKSPDPSLVFPSTDAYAAFYTSKYLIQDTYESIWSHMRTGFSPDPMMAYLEFWGVMQALIIQQDAISQIHKSLMGVPPVIQPPSPWYKIRELRNKCAGHPAKTDVRGGHVRTFMGRNFGNYDLLSYEQYDTTSGQTTYPIVNLKKMIEDYDMQAGDYLSAALDELRKKCP